MIDAGFGLAGAADDQPAAGEGALADGLEYQAFSAEYIAHILAARRRVGAEPAALQLTRSADLLELEIPEPDLSIYDRD